MRKTNITRAIMCLLIVLMAAAFSACTKSPEQVREWIQDKRAPVKMKEFIQNPRFSLESKIEAVMVLTERSNCVELPDALGEPLKTDEVNQIVAGVIPRMDALLAEKPAYETKVKDAAYYLLDLDLNDENRDALMKYLRNWLDSDNFFLSAEKAGRVEQKRLFERLGAESLPIYKTALEKTLNQFEEALKKEADKEAELNKQGKKFKVVSRPSDRLTTTISTTLSSLEALKLPGASDMVAQMFLKRIEAKYPNMPRTYVLPFASNPSALLLPMAKRIVTDPEYKNETLNYYKDVMLQTYYRNVQKKAGSEVCTTLIQTDRTGYIRWDCLELLTIDKGREGFAALIQTLPADYASLAVPADHPVFVSEPSRTFWNSLRLYCAYLPKNLNNQVPLDVFRQLVSKGTMTTRMLSMACLSTLGNESDVALLASFADEKTDIKEWGMQVSTVGELANFTSALLEKRLAMMKKAEEEAKAKGNVPAGANAVKPGAPAAAAAPGAANAAAPAAAPTPAGNAAAAPAAAKPANAAPAPAAAKPAAAPAAKAPAPAGK